MIAPPLVWFCASRRDDPGRFIPQRINNEEKTIFDHAENDAAFLVICLTPVDPFECEGITEDIPRSLEGDTVNGSVASGLVIIPLEGTVVHDGTA